MVGYKLERSGPSGWMFCGTTPQEVANVLKAEIEADMELPTDERCVITLTPFEITQAEIDAMPEFPGW